MGFLIDAFNQLQTWLLILLTPLHITEPVLQFMLVSAILGLSIYLTLYTGMFSLANGGFMAIGAYISVLLTQHMGWSLGWSILVGMFVAGLVAVPIGLPVLRLRDIYLAIATIGFGEVVRILALNLDDLIALLITRLVEANLFVNSLVAYADNSDVLDITIRDNGVVRVSFELLGGARGIKGIPKLTETWMLVLFLVIVIYFIVRLHRSRLGRAMAAVRQDERAAANMGIDVVYVKNAVFIMSAVIAAAAGGLSGHLTRIIDPSFYGFDLVVNMLAYAVLGGIQTWLGPVVGGMVLTALPETLRGFQELRGLINGLILLGAIVYLPGGLVDIKGFRGLVSYLRDNRFNRKAAKGDADAGT